MLWKPLTFLYLLANTFFFFFQFLVFLQKKWRIGTYMYIYPYNKNRNSSCMRQQFSTALRSTAHLELRLCPIYNQNSLLKNVSFVPTKIYYHHGSFGSTCLGLLLSGHGSLSQGDHLFHKFRTALNRGIIFFQN